MSVCNRPIPSHLQSPCPNIINSELQYGNGGGIGGLCLAVALSRYPDIDVQVYEAAATFKEIGAGVMIWGRTWNVLTLLGMHRTLRQVAGVKADGSEDPPFGFDFRTSDQSEEGKRFFLLSLPYTCLLFHRAHFIDVLVDRLPDDIAHFGKRLTSYTSQRANGPIALQFADGSDAECDLLIGCDGIKSTVRHQLLRDKAACGHPELLDHIEPRWSGWVAYRALVPAEKLPVINGQRHSALDRPMMYCGLHKHVVSYSIAHGKFANVVAFYSQPVDENSKWDGPWVSDVSGDEVRQTYTGWEPEVQSLLQPIEKAMKWSMHELRALPTYIHGRVALLGDAAHAMTPHQGAGAGQAIEDAFVLAGLLGHPSTNLGNLGKALEAYEHVRLPFANRVLEGSRSSGKMYEFWNEEGNDYARLAPSIEAQFDWVKDEDPEKQLARALRWMHTDQAVPRNLGPKL